MTPSSACLPWPGLHDVAVDAAAGQRGAALEQGGGEGVRRALQAGRHAGSHHPHSSPDRLQAIFYLVWSPKHIGLTHLPSSLPPSLLLCPTTYPPSIRPACAPWARTGSSGATWSSPTTARTASTPRASGMGPLPRSSTPVPPSSSCFTGSRTPAHESTHCDR